MKKIKILILCLSFCTAALAQDDTYKGPAKMYVTNFYKQAADGKKAVENGSENAAKTKIEQMEKSLAQIKTKDPSYNTSTMEAELKGLKEKMESNNADNVAKQKEEDNKKAEANSYNGYNGPAVRNVKNFWDLGSKSPDNLSETDLNVAINNMQYSLNSVKQKDPSYNTSEMEATLESYRRKRKEIQLAEANRYSGDKTKSQQEESVSDDAGELFKDLFEEENLQAGAGMVTGEKLKARMEKYNEKAAKLLSMDYSNAKISHTRMCKGSINGMKMKTDRELKDVDVMLGEFRDKESMEVGYYTIQFHLAYWDAAQKVFSEEASYKEMYNKVKASADKMGSLESMMAKADANNTQYIKDTKLPNAVAKDAKLEKILTDGFNKKFTAQNGATALKAVLTQDGWTTIRNPLTSVIEGRERSAKVAYKGSDGKCYVLIDYVFIHEEYIGGTFTNTKAVYKGLDGKEMLCENVK